MRKEIDGRELLNTASELVSVLVTHYCIFPRAITLPGWASVALLSPLSYLLSNITNALLLYLCRHNFSLGKMAIFLKGIDA